MVISVVAIENISHEFGQKLLEYLTSLGTVGEVYSLSPYNLNVYNSGGGSHSSLPTLEPFQCNCFIPFHIFALESSDEGNIHTQQRNVILECNK